MCDHKDIIEGYYFKETKFLNVAKELNLTIIRLQYSNISMGKGK